MLHNLYVFNRSGVCLYYKEWKRDQYTLRDSPEEDRKLVFGLLFSLKQFVSSVSPEPDREGGLRRIVTESYAMHVLEVATGLKFVLNTDLTAGDMRSTLNGLYREVYLPRVARNPLYKPGTAIELPAFDAALETYVRSLPQFA